MTAAVLTDPDADRHAYTATARAIAAVVTGTGWPPALTGEARRLALQAMAALGYSSAHIGARLGVCPRGVASLASRLGVKLPRQREFVDTLAVQLVRSGATMRLTGSTLDAALRALAADQATATTAARRLRLKPGQVRERAAELGLTLAEQPDHLAWWGTYYEKIKNKETVDA